MPLIFHVTGVMFQFNQLMLSIQLWPLPLICKISDFLGRLQSEKGMNFLQNYSTMV